MAETEKERFKAPRHNTNFVRPGDVNTRGAQLGGLINKNFVSPESADYAARRSEAAGGVAVRREGESVTAFKKRSRTVAGEQGRKRATMSPDIAKRDLARLELKWKGRVPTEEEAVKYAEEFDFMNDMRHALGLPDVDYTQPREAEKDHATEKFVQFQKNTDESVRQALCEQSNDLSLMRTIAVHDPSESVRKAAEKRMAVLFAQAAAQ